ncbi:MAG: HNH endonuclease, partial [Sedimentisphaerales bacterium]|nr:HNH endonuclease [Sedimentisphaerales bacterium]
MYRRVRYGYAFRRIRLAGPKYAKVDPADYKRLRGYEWLVKKRRKNFYALRHSVSGKTGKESLIYMHQEIIEVPEGMVIDHINRDGVDNRRANLRAATHSQNMCNRRKRLGTTHSKYRGICWRKKDRKWQAKIGFEKKRIHLGTFSNEIDAAKAYDRAARKYHGEFASPNFPESGIG